MLKPIFRMPADSSSGRSASIASAALIWSGARPAANRPAPSPDCLVGERDIAGVVRRERQRDAAHLGLHRIDRIRLGLDGEMAGIVHPRDPGVELGERADGEVLAAVDRRLARGFGARGGERLGREDDVRLVRFAAGPCPTARRAGSCRLRERTGRRRPDVRTGRRRRRAVEAAMNPPICRSRRCCSCRPPRHPTDRSANIPRRGGSAWKIPSPSGTRSACAHRARAPRVRRAARRA